MRSLTTAGWLGGRWHGPRAAALAAGCSCRRLFRPQLLADPRCAILACHRDGDLVAGVIAYTAAGVTSISNLFGTKLPADQQALGRLRVWERQPAS
jgi:hypothetical protein